MVAVPRPDQLFLTRVGHEHRRELPDRLEHSVPGSTLVFVVLDEQTRQPVEHPVAEVIRKGKVVGLGKHTVLVARDGTRRPIDDSAAPIRDAAGQSLHDEAALVKGVKSAATAVDYLNPPRWWTIALALVLWRRHK